jgi:histone H3/H4
MDQHVAKFSEKTVEQLSKMACPEVKFSSEGLALTTELLRIYTLEAAHRAAAQARAEGGTLVKLEHVEKILAQFLLDFL